MFKSSKRDKAEGTLDWIGGRVLELVGAVTGRSSHKAKGKAARGRGTFRSTRGDVKRAGRGGVERAEGGDVKRAGRGEGRRGRR